MTSVNLYLNSNGLSVTHNKSRGSSRLDQLKFTMLKRIAWHLWAHKTQNEDQQDNEAQCNTENLYEEQDGPTKNLGVNPVAPEG